MIDVLLTQSLTDTTVIHETWVHGVTDLFTDMDGEVAAVGATVVLVRLVEAWKEVRLQEYRYNEK